MGDLCFGCCGERDGFDAMGAEFFDGFFGEWHTESGGVDAAFPEVGSFQELSKLLELVCEGLLAEFDESDGGESLCLFLQDPHDGGVVMPGEVDAGEEFFFLFFDFIGFAGDVEVWCGAVEESIVVDEGFIGVGEFAEEFSTESGFVSHGGSDFFDVDFESGVDGFVQGDAAGRESRVELNVVEDAFFSHGC